MKRIDISRIFFTLITSLVLISPVTGAEIEDAEKAYRQKDYPTALAAYHAAAKTKEDLAYGKLGGMYLYGVGTRKNYTEAFIWFGMAHRAGDNYGRKFQETAASVMSRAEIDAAEELLDERWEFYKRTDD
ncbi:MAG: SEL1-like repeat protein [Gammaproteobacteria bacterium]|nr:SEL1-like repeat protein [Gammaproteobacteria bacterium]